MKARNFITIATGMAIISTVAVAAKTPDSPELNLQKTITVSGVSSGGYMSNQFHVAHSDMVSGVGIISAGPYFCSQGNLMTAMGQCLADGSALAGKDLKAALAHSESKQSIAPLSHLQQDKVWLLHGTLDKRVGRAVNDALYEQYQAVVAPNSIKYVSDKPFNHHLPTLTFGVKCDEAASPFIAACDYDAAGEMLSWITAPKDTANASTQTEGGFYTLAQKSEIDGTATGLAEEAWLYVPKQCAKGGFCQLHISFHGCQQNTASIGLNYVKKGGFNAWADKLDLVVLYPQIASGNALNPLACWDWWGYTGSEFHTQFGPQIKATKQLANSLMSGNAQLTAQVSNEESE